MSESLWNRCLRVLESELPEQQFNTWVRPLQAIERDGELKLLAPNRYVIEWLGQNALPRIKELIRAFAEDPVPELVLDVGTRAGAAAPVVAMNGIRRRPMAQRPRLAGLRPRYSAVPSIPGLHSTPSSRARAISWPRPPRFKSREIRAGPITPCSFTAAWVG